MKVLACLLTSIQDMASAVPQILKAPSTKISGPSTYCLWSA